MELATSIALIEKGVVPNTTQRWADLGAGAGLFTNALSKLVSPGSTIYAVDTNTSSFRAPNDTTNITIESMRMDFTSGLGKISDLDGIIMANSLHFVRDKIVTLKKLSAHLNKQGRFIIVEYNTDNANRWVPHPISLQNLIKLVGDHHLGTVEKIGAADSAYQSSGMYSAMIIPR